MRTCMWVRAERIIFVTRIKPERSKTDITDDMEYVRIWHGVCAYMTLLKRVWAGMRACMCMYLFCWVCSFIVGNHNLSIWLVLGRKASRPTAVRRDAESVTTRQTLHQAFRYVGYVHDYILVCAKLHHMRKHMSVTHTLPTNHELLLASIQYENLRTRGHISFYVMYVHVWRHVTYVHVWRQRMETNGVHPAAVCSCVIMLMNMHVKHTSIFMYNIIWKPHMNSMYMSSENSCNQCLKTCTDSYAA